MIDPWIQFGLVMASSCIIAGIIGTTKNPISKYLMKDLENK